MQFAERNLQRPLIRPKLSQAVQREIDAFADADAGGASQQEGIGRQVVGAAQFLLQQLIVLGRKRSGQVLGPWREVLAADEVRLEVVAVGGQIVQQPAEAEETVGARFVAQRRLLLAEPAESAEQVWVAPELGKPVDPRKSVVGDRIAPQGEGESLQGQGRVRWLAAPGDPLQQLG